MTPKAPPASPKPFRVPPAFGVGASDQVTGSESDIEGMRPVSLGKTHVSL